MIGIIPIGGHATRMNGIPKFLLPVGDTFLLAKLYREMQEAGAETIAIGVKASNRALVEQNVPDDALIYEVNTETMSQTVLHARQYIDMTQPVLFGMPDTYWTTPNMYPQLVERLGGAVAIAGLWHTPPAYTHKRGMCSTYMTKDRDLFLREVIDKPQEKNSIWAWGAIAWREKFWQYINPYDKHVGFALQRAIDAGHYVRGHTREGQFFDCGTPDEYYDCIRSIEWSADVSA